MNEQDAKKVERPNTSDTALYPVSRVEIDAYCDRVEEVIRDQVVRMRIGAMPSGRNVIYAISQLK